MSTPHNCPKCGAALPTDAPEGLCPACLMSGGFDTDATVRMTPSQRPSPAPHFAPTPTPEELAPLFPQLEIIELLGRGGMGTVYKARQTKLNRFVALKIISAEAGADPHFAERFQREAQALAKLNHPNIVSVFDFGESNGLFFFLMEFVDGANLRTLIRSGEMKPEAALALIPAFCDALQYAHDEGVVHRDIKPENVLVDKKGRVKIADFGLAKLLGHDAPGDTLTRTGMYLGTPRYMAPEQVEKPETVDHRADIYSLGVVFYEMLTGEIPMGRFAPPSQKVQVDVRFDEIVLHALERDVTLRYQHASEIKTDVQNVTGAVSTPLPDATARSDAAEIASQPRLSRMALIGAIWALLGLIAVIPSMLLTWTASRVEGGSSGPVYEQPPVAFTVFMAVLLFIGMGAPIGTTILGAISMNKIRKSGGRLYGLPLAFADVVFFPLLLLHGGMAVMLGLLIITIMKVAGVNAGLGMAEMGLLAMVPLIADFFIVRALWRKVAGKPATAGGDIGSKLNLAAIGLLIAGILNAFGGLIWIGSNVVALSEATKQGAPIAGLVVTLLLSLCSIAVVYYTIGSALFLMHRKDDGDITFPLVMAALVPPGCIFGLPSAIYALLLLSKPEAKALFLRISPEPVPPSEATGAAPAATKPSQRHLLSACLVLLMIFGFFFGFSFQAKHSGSPAGMIKIITVGALDPLFTSESGPSGFQTSLNFFSWSFFAVVVAGIAFGALWRVGREDQGKVPRDPAWWRDWWKQVGIWGGLLLVACIVRSAIDPEQVLRPPGDRTVDSKFTKLFSSGPEFRADHSRIPTTRTPGRADYAYAFAVPANHRLYVWLEWWKDGKRTIDQNFNTGYVAKPGQRYDAGVQIVFTDGKIAGPTTAGLTRIDWIFYDPAGHADSGNWRPDFFAGMTTTISWGKKSSWSPKVGETVTLLEIAGGKDSVLSGPITDDGLRAGHWQAAMLLRARIEPVSESLMSPAPVTKMNAWNDNEEPTPALLGLGEQLGATLGPFTDARNLREQIAYRIKKEPAERAKAEKMLKNAGVTFAADEKPEELVKKLEQLLGLPPSP